jgi:hypothetical protein
MKFWKRYKAKKELKQKLDKARFINFYDNEIDLKDGRPIALETFAEEYLEKHCSISIYFAWKNYIFLNYFDENKGYFKRTWHYGKNWIMRDKYFDELNDFFNSDKFIERLNEYNELKKEYEGL